MRVHELLLMHFKGTFFNQLECNAEATLLHIDEFIRAHEKHISKMSTVLLCWTARPVKTTNTLLRTFFLQAWIPPVPSLLAVSEDSYNIDEVQNV